MAVPASDTHKVLADEIESVLKRARSIRSAALSRKAQLAAGPVSSEIILQIAEEAQIVSDWLTAQAAIPGIGAYAAANLTPAVTAQGLGSDITALIAALDAVVAEVTSTFPATGYMLDPPLVDGVRSLKNYSSAATADLRTALQAVADAIES